MDETEWPDVGERILLRKNYLEKLVDQALELPKEWQKDSFTKSSEWHREDLGIYPVGSKRDWNKKSGDHRSLLVLIDIALKKLKARSQPTKAKTSKALPLGVRVARLTEENKALTAALDNAVTDWHEAREALELANKDAITREALLEFTQRKLVEAEAEVRSLTIKLHARDGLLVV